MDTFLKLALWNANGLTQHIHEITAFIKEHKLDIVLVSETHFTSRSYFNIKRH